MNFAKKIFTMLLITYVSFANADNYEGYTSSIEGVGLWWLPGPGESSNVEEIAGYYVKRSFRFGENPEFAIFCDGKNKLYIYELGQKGFICRNIKLVQKGNERIHVAGEGDFDKLEYVDVDEADKKQMLEYIKLAKKDKYSEAGEKSYTVLLSGVKIDSEGIYTVSKNKLVQGRWVESSPTRDDLEQSKKIASLHIKEVHREKNNSYKSVIGYSNEKISKLTFWDNDETYTLKIRVGDTEIILLPTLYESEEEGNLISTVVLHEHDSYSFIGHVYGCLLSVGADGFPEIILENCYSTESKRINYIKIYPKIKNLVSYDHS